MENSEVILLREQFSPGNIQERYCDNIVAIMNYENAVLSVARNAFELMFAYPQETDPGIYVVAVNGKVSAVNNKRAVCRYLESSGDEPGVEILVHKLGTRLDLGLYNLLREHALVSA